MLAPETVLQSRYRIIRLLGQGGMGAVYEATDERLDTTVALKETLFADERLRKQFEREARLLARMHHPALPRVSDHFAEGDGQFLVMQFIPGDDLSQMMARKQGPFPPDQVLTWGDQLLDALDYLHTQEPQIIHRDIKPQNLKLTGRGQIILLDFGLAKGQTGGVSMVTTSASIFGYTPNYAPLEQIQGLGTDARSDIYALSATLYHLMTAVKPPDALTRAAALVNGQPDPLAPANAISQSIGPEVAGVLAKAMSQNRDQRYPTAATMRAALKGTGEAETLMGRSEAATVILAPSAATLADTTEDSTATKLKTGETTVASPARSTRQRRVAPWAIGVAALVLIGVLFGGFYAYQRRNNSDALGQPPVTSEPTPNNAVSPRESPAGEHSAAAPVSGGLTEVKPLVVPEHPTGETAKIETPKKGEKAKNNEKAGSKPAKSPDEGESFNPVAPKVPDPNVPDYSRTDRRNLPGVPQVRTLRDGTQVMILADGTRIVTMPNGTKRVVPPGVKVPRRKRVQ
jgi:serine/threonine protein kinase